MGAEDGGLGPTPSWSHVSLIEGSFPCWEVDIDGPWLGPRAGMWMGSIVVGPWHYGGQMLALVLSDSPFPIKGERSWEIS